MFIIPKDWSKELHGSESGAGDEKGNFKSSSKSSKNAQDSSL